MDWRGGSKRHVDQSMVYIIGWDRNHLEELLLDSSACAIFPSFWEIIRVAYPNV